MLDNAADPAWKAQVESVPIEGCTVKLNVLLRELPNFTSRPGTLEPHHYGQINAPLTKSEWKDGFSAARRGELPDQLWCELYFQSVHDSTVSAAGRHTMSIFAQYVPYAFGSGSWDTRRVRGPTTGSRLPRALLLQYPRSSARRAGPRSSRHRGEGRPNRRSYLPGRMPSALHVVTPPLCSHTDARRLSLRSRDTPRGLCHRHQRPQRRDGSSRGPGGF